MPCGASVQVSGAAANWVGEGHDSTHAEALGAQMLSTLTLPRGHDAQPPSGVWYRPNPHAVHSPYVHGVALAGTVVRAAAHSTDRAYGESVEEAAAGHTRRAAVGRAEEHRAAVALRTASPVAGRVGGAQRARRRTTLGGAAGGAGRRRDGPVRRAVLIRRAQGAHQAGWGVSEGPRGARGAGRGPARARVCPRGAGHARGERRRPAVYYGRAVRERSRRHVDAAAPPSIRHLPRRTPRDRPQARDVDVDSRTLPKRVDLMRSQGVGQRGLLEKRQIPRTPPRSRRSRRQG